MPIRDDFERPPRPPRVGKIRGGIFEEGRDGKGGHPKQTSTIVLTSDNEVWLRRLQIDYGGQAEQYIPQGQTDPIWRLITESDHLMVLLPFPVVEENFEEWYELWATGGLERRCDGIDAQVAEWDAVEENVAYRPHECVCKVAKEAAAKEAAAAEDEAARNKALAKGRRACSVNWRLSVWLPQTGLGVWQLQSSSKHGRVQIDGSLRLLERTFPDVMNRVPVRLAYTPQAISYPDAKQQKRRRGTKRIWTLGLAIPLEDATHMLQEGQSGAALLQRSLRALPSGDGSGEGEAPAPAAEKAGARKSGGRVGAGDGPAPAPSALLPYEAYLAARQELASYLDLSVIQVRTTYVKPWFAKRKKTDPALPATEKDWPEDTLRALTEHLSRVLEGGQQMGLKAQ
jgi:hypothetical protein